MGIGLDGGNALEFLFFLLAHDVVQGELNNICCRLYTRVTRGSG